MVRKVHAVVIARRRGDRLIQTLEALTGQTRSVDSITVVDLTADPSSEEVFREHLGRGDTVRVLPARAQAGWSEALNLARAELPEDGWIWALRDDTTPDEGALKALYSTVDGAPSVVMAGPKQRVAATSGFLREFGETITLWGERQAVVDRELDQGQYDRMSDVLSVGDAGLLIRLDVFDQIGGADPALDPLDAPLDLGIRVRLAGHRVVAVPGAIVWVERGPADWRAGKDLGSTAMYRLDRQAWLYRRFAYSAWWALIPLILLALPMSFVRQAWQFAVKRPDLAVADLIATLGALWQLPRAIVAKTRLDRSKTASWTSLRPLRMTVTDHRRRRQLRSEARFAKAEEQARTKPKPAFWPAGAWLLIGFVLLGALLSGPVLNAVALRGGGLLPLTGELSALWAEVRWLQPESVGAVWGSQLIPADPAALLIALVGNLTWWEPSQAFVWLWLAAPLVSGLVAWWAASQFLQRQLGAAVFSVAWVLQPTFILALTEGRWQAVLLHVFLPWLLGSALTAHSSWQRAAGAGFASAAVSAVAPILIPALVVGWTVLVLVRGWANPLRAVLGTLPLALAPTIVWWLPRFGAPGDIALLPGIGRFFADPGVGQTGGSADWWWYLLGWPELPGDLALAGLTITFSTFVLWCVVPVLALALAVFATSRSDAHIIFGVTVAVGLVTAAMAPFIGQGYAGLQPITVWSGSGVMVVSLGVVAAAAATLDALSPAGWQWGRSVSLQRALAGGLGTVVIVGSVLAISSTALRSWGDDAVVSGLAETRTLPALVAAEATSNPDLGTLVITALDDGTYQVSVERGSGATLERTSSLYRLRPAQPGASGQRVADLAASLVQPSSSDPAAGLRDEGIRFVLFRGDPEAEAALAMGQRPSLIPAGQTEQSVLWQIDGVAPETAEPLARNAAQRGADLLWLVVWALWGVLALPTERTPKRTAEDGDEPHSLKELEEDTDD